MLISIQNTFYTYVEGSEEQNASMQFKFKKKHTHKKHN